MRPGQSMIAGSRLVALTWCLLLHLRATPNQVVAWTTTMGMSLRDRTASTTLGIGRSGEVAFAGIRPVRGTMSLAATDATKSSSSFISNNDVVDLDRLIEESKTLLRQAAIDKSVDSDTVQNALITLEQCMRKRAKLDYPVTADTTLAALNGSWRLVFTTGTAKTQKKFGKIQYFPLKAVQKFEITSRDNDDDDDNDMKIENAIYAFDTNFPLIKFSGQFQFDKRKRQLPFQFDRVTILDFLEFKFGPNKQNDDSDAANKDPKENNSKSFFLWISADDEIATARGAGGGLALWKRVKEDTK